MSYYDTIFDLFQKMFAILNSQKQETQDRIIVLTITFARRKL
jgi:hypothetical protein